MRLTALLTCEGAGIVDFEIEPGSLGPEGWYEKNMHNGEPIGLTVYYDTPDPGSTGYYAAYYRVHWMGDEPDWSKWEFDDDDDGAGNDCDQIDMVELTIVPCKIGFVQPTGCRGVIN